mmetsp:Transcript_75507/g.149271  ORF Transcript_75507/g.149271 Transcript_75507/m.149271 type:complete len:201 (-) Transcript_75507:183-785(-)
MREALIGIRLTIALLVCCRTAQAAESASSMQALAKDHIKSLSSYSPWVFLLVILQCSFMCCIAFYAWVLYCVWRRFVDNNSSSTRRLAPCVNSAPESTFSTLSPDDMSPQVAEEGKTECTNSRRPGARLVSHRHLAIAHDDSPARAARSDASGMGRLLGSCGCSKPGLLSLGHGKLYSALTGIYAVADTPGSDEDTAFFL